ncbi:MAG: EAL domain-containing protein [Helicobacteraceae bacterium]|nr:EAL domain-containing protein [Helicobacteraceae bacterium]
MFKDKISKLLSFSIIFLLIFSTIHLFITFKENKEVRTSILMEEAQSITAFFKSFRKTYQDIFINNHIQLNEKTIELLPVKTTNKISEHFSNALDSKVKLRTISDRPRNALNMASEKELQIIEEFKNDTNKKYIFEEGNDYVYNYYEPLYITKTCLKCHGYAEDAPQLIQQKYKTAFDYKLGELRGIINLEINKNELLSAIDHKNQHNLVYIIVSMLILMSIIITLYIKLKVNVEHSKSDLEKKNKFLEQKNKEFHDLQTALGLSEIISTADTDGNILSVNDKFCEASGYSREELIGRNHNIIRHPDTPNKVFKHMWKTIKSKKVFKAIIQNRKKDGTSYHVDSTIVPTLDEDGNIAKYISIRHDIEDMMNHKVLLQEVIASAKNSILVLAKLEGFDELEEFYTSEIITKLENKFLKNSLSYFPEECGFKKVYKLEHGEFAFIQEFSDDLDEKFIKLRENSIKIFQDNIKEAKFTIDGYQFNPTVLISVSSEKDKMLENATLGLKRILKDGHTFINSNGLSDEMKLKAQKNIDTVNMIKYAINEKNIVSYFQPIYNNKTNQIDKYESLVRLVKSTNDIVSPFFFLETAKKAKYYNQITKIVLENSFETLLNTDKDITINLSFLDIEDEETRAYLYNITLNCNQCHRVVIELLEDETAKDFKVIKEFIEIVKSKGVKIAIDDFGSGYSNFERLLDFQPDILKIDGSLIRDIDTNTFSRNIVETIQTFATKEGIETVAEFVHSKEIFDIVNEIGIDYTQGYYISEPKPIDKL